MTDSLGKDALNAALRNDFPTFVGKVFLTLNTGAEFKMNWHHYGISYFLHQMWAGEFRRGIVNSCPRSLKSTIISVAWVAYVLGHDPTKMFIVVSHNMELAKELSFLFRKVVNAKWYKDAFPTMRGKPDADNELIFRTSLGGGRRATSVNSDVTGLGGTDIIIDDPIDASIADNPDQCAIINRWITKVLMSRLNDKATGTVLVVMQRISIHDTTAFLLGMTGWKSLVLPAIAQKDMDVPIGEGEAHHWKQGELLHPEFLSQAILDEQLQLQGHADFSAQYLQIPIQSGGGAIDVSKFKRFNQLPQAIDFWFLSVDASSGVESGSYSVIQLWAASNGRMYLYGQKRAHLEFPALRSSVIDIAKKWGVRYILVENASAGQALLQELHGHYPLEEAWEKLVSINPVHAKTVRMGKAMIMADAGKVWLPAERSWIDGLVSELQAFPKGAHDDQVDALSQAINWFRGYLAGPPEVTVTMV